MTVYRHFDSKKYVKIKYRASDIILAILGFVTVSVLYHLGNFYGFVVGAVFIMLYDYYELSCRLRSFVKHDNDNENASVLRANNAWI